MNSPEVCWRLLMKYLVLKIVAQRGLEESLKRRVLFGANWYEHSRAEALRQRAPRFAVWLRKVSVCLQEYSVGSQGQGIGACGSRDPGRHKVGTSVD